MVRSLLACLVLATVGNLATAQTETNPLFADDNRLDELRARFASGVPTVAAVDELQAEAFARFHEGNCVAAIPALEELALQSNLLANILASTLEPFYSTYSSDRESASYGPGGITALVEAEREANSRKLVRDQAYVALAECHERSGSINEALVYYGQALDLMSATNKYRDLWLRAREGVYRIVGYSIEAP